MNEVKVDLKFFLYVFIGFTITSFIVTATLLYNISKVYDENGNYKWKHSQPTDDNQPLDFKIWSRDPLVMQGLAGIRARRAYATPDVVKLTEISFNDTCIGFVWSKFHLSNIIKYTVEISSMKETMMTPITSDIGAVYMEFIQCELNVSTPYLVKLTAFDQNPGSVETASDIMWTTHQVPPQPDPPEVVSVTETTITVSLPEVTLMQGPLSAVEVRIKPGERRIPLLEAQQKSPWSTFLKRRKRNTEMSKYEVSLPRMVEIPHSVLELVNTDRHMGSTKDIFGDPIGSDRFTFKFDLSSENLVCAEKAGHMQVTLREVERKGKYVSVHNETFGAVKHGRDKTEKTWNRRTARKVNRQLPMTLVNKKHVFDEVVSFLYGYITHTSSADNSSDLKQMSHLLTDRENEKQSSKHSELVVMKKYISESGRCISLVSRHGSDIIRLKIDSNPDLSVIYTAPRPEMIKKLFLPASSQENLLLLQQLMKNTEDILESNVFAKDLNMDVLHLFSVTSDRAHNNTCYTCLHETDIVHDARTMSTRSRITDIKENMLKVMRLSNQLIPGVVSEQTRDLLTRKRRSLFGLFRRHYQKSGPEIVREIEDRLEVDPYQTWHVIKLVAGQSVVVKKGHGYFITDHYGVRQPYFNNSKLERSLRRLSHYQEARDFIFYGKSLLNLTELNSVDLPLLYKRLNKIMEINRLRRNKLFLDMFEDFLFWSKDSKRRQVGGSSVPSAAKLGLPPGYPVAQLTGGQAQNLTIGDYSMHGGLPNPPLEPGKEYEVVITVMSTVADVTKHSWSSINVTTLPEMPKIVSPIFVVLIGAFLAVCLFVLLLRCFVLWCSKRMKKMTHDDGTWDDIRLQIFPERAMDNQEAPSTYSDYYTVAPYNSIQPSTGWGEWNENFPAVDLWTNSFLSSQRSLSSSTITATYDTEDANDNQFDQVDGGTDRLQFKRETDSTFMKEIRNGDDDNKVEEETMPKYVKKIHKSEDYWN